MMESRKGDAGFAEEGPVQKEGESAADAEAFVQRAALAGCDRLCRRGHGRQRLKL